MANKMLSMGAAKIGPAAWRNNSMKEIKVTTNVIHRSDKSIELGKILDPVPHLRDIVAELSNDQARQYSRQTRTVVTMLRESMLSTNEEIKKLSRGKEQLEKALDHIRKDIKLNQESQEIRKSRPKREKEEPDGADGMIGAERMQLLNVKRMLESQLQLVQQHLSVLDSARSRLNNVTQERVRVLDLLCHYVTSQSAGHSASPSVRRSGSVNMLTGRKRPSYSACMDPCSCLDGDLTLSNGPGGLSVDPLGPYTPEADHALADALEARERSVILRKDLAVAISRAQDVQNAMHKEVNSSLQKKIAETDSVKSNLLTSAAATRMGLNRAQRWFDTTERAWNYTRGPLSSSDLLTRERLDRPTMRVFQRHPGNVQPEAQEIVRSGDGLLQSLSNTGQNIGLLRMAQLRLKDDITDKGASIDVDSAVLKQRRRKANHRWTINQVL